MYLMELETIGEIKNISITENNASWIVEVDKDTENFMINENEKDEDLLLEATKMHIAIAKFLWQIKL